MQNSITNRFGKLSAKLAMAAFCALVFAFGANAQSVLVPPPSLPPALQATTEQTGDTNQVDGAGGMTSVSPSTAMQNKNPFQWGSVTFHPHISYGFTYATGIQSQPGQSSDSFINTLTPGITFDLGQHWQLGYLAGIKFYSDHNFQDTVDHTISLTGHTAYEDWTFSLSQNVALTSDPLVQTAQQTDQQTYSTSLGATYQINSDLFLQLGVSQSFLLVNGSTNVVNGSTNASFASGLTSSRNWSTMDGLNYQWGPNLSAGAGAGFGYTVVDQGTDMMDEQIQGQISYQLARKIRLSLNAGYQFNQFINSAQPGLATPIFGVSMTYQPFDVTTISLSANRTISASSYFINQVTETTGFTAGISQRLLRKLYLGLSGGYANTSYQASVPGFSVSREDNSSYFSVNLTTTFLKRGTASLSYSRNENSSSAGGFGFLSNQIGFQLGYSY
jgi:hypothetical protein